MTRDRRTRGEREKEKERERKRERKRETEVVVMTCLLLLLLVLILRVIEVMYLSVCLLYAVVVVGWLVGWLVGVMFVERGRGEEEQNLTGMNVHDVSRGSIVR